MATTVYNIEEVALQDGTTVTLKPLNIKNMRKFMSKIEEFTSAEDEDQSLNALVAAAAICLRQERPEFWNEESLSSTDEFEEVADMPTIYKILDVCGGIKLNDPNLLAAAAEAAAAAAGQN